MPDNIAFAAAPLLVFKMGKMINVDGGVAVVPAEPHTLTREDGSPHQAGDVLSVQRDGSFQVRPRTNIGGWETAKLAGDKLIYNNYDTGQIYVIPFMALT